MKKVACATDDGVNLIKRHFGDAEYYAVYEVNNAGYTHVETIRNNTIDGKDGKNGHGDAIKAKHIMMILMEKNIEILLNKNFGPNIYRIKLKFVPVITGKNTIEEGLNEIIEHYNEINTEWEKGSERSFISLKQTTG